MNGQGFQCNADLVFCIDATGSMGSIIGRVKEVASTFHERITQALTEYEREVENLRIKVVVFRDYYCDGSHAMTQSEFFDLPNETEEFNRFISSIEACGGGDEPENSLEALALAMNSDWVMEGARKRHIIVVWTDASAHALEKAIESEKPILYPENLPTSLMELTDWWTDKQMGKMNQSAKRLIIFAPDDSPWSEIATNWDNAVHVPSKAGEGLEDVDMELVLDCIAGSI